MILGFSTRLKGRPTYFVEKIHSGLLQNDLKVDFENDDAPQEFNVNVLAECEPKIHTIREDKNNRWKTGMKIDFFINCRQKDMFRFAPTLPVVSTQTIEIIYEYDSVNHKNRNVVWIEDMVFYDATRRVDKGILQLAQNDGFDSIEDFFNYFNDNFKGKIIHWTTKQY